MWATIVAAARCVQLRAGGTDPPRQLGLDVHVDVLERLLEFEIAGLDLMTDFQQALFDRRLLVGRDDARFEQAFGLGDGAADVVGIETPVKGHGFAVALNELAGGLREAAFPHGGQMGQRLKTGAESSGKRRRCNPRLTSAPARWR